MTLYHEIVQMRAGATPQSFDGSGTANFNGKAKKLIAIVAAPSMSVYTTDEGFGGAVKLSSSNFRGDRYFPFGFLFNSGPSTNSAVKGFGTTIVPTDIDIAPNSSMTVNISTVIGSTQTGTIDITFDFVYDDGSTPQELINKYANAHNSLIPVAVKGFTLNYYQAIAATSETALTGNATSVANVPQEAVEIVGEVNGLALDTAVTQSEEITGKIRHDLSLTEAKAQDTPIGGGMPNLGTEVEGGALYSWSFNPMYLRTEGKEVTVRQYVTMYSAITGGADLASMLAWR